MSMIGLERWQAGDTSERAGSTGMTKSSIHPSTIDGIKRLAKRISNEHGIPHMAALDQASITAGYANYRDAQRRIADNHATAFEVHITVNWRRPDTREMGSETLALSVSKPLDEIVKPAQYRVARNLGSMKRYASDRIAWEWLAETPQEAREVACSAARTLQFMDITGLRPSRSSRIFPNHDRRNEPPLYDHGSDWYDPVARHHLITDEPYSAQLLPQREEWARRFGWQVGAPRWRGMHSPDGGCFLYVTADTSKGYSIQRVLDTLNRAAPPIVSANWNGISTRGSRQFVTSGRPTELDAQDSRKSGQ